MPRLRATCLLALGFLVGPALARDEGGTTWTFETDEPGTIAKGFTGEVGEWKVVQTPEGKALMQQAKNSNPTFNVALIAESDAKDVDLSVRIRAVAGELDQGGGLVWRAKDARNYYVARFNHLEDNYRIYKVVDGKRMQLASADIQHHDGWTALRIIMKGDHIECYLDGKKYLDVRDSTFPEVGKIGLWSKADARTQFDDLTLRRP
ncbi:MAG: DUF1080 domain-containing protein [Isosphaeraceae bacterium]|nr:DUF1080 domain-containing protein [Isosphaeraceae bacterium]